MLTKSLENQNYSENEGFKGSKIFRNYSKFLS